MRPPVLATLRYATRSPLPRCLRAHPKKHFRKFPGPRGRRTTTTRCGRRSKQRRYISIPGGETAGRARYVSLLASYSSVWRSSPYRLSTRRCPSSCGTGSRYLSSPTVLPYSQVPRGGTPASSRPTPGSTLRQERTRPNGPSESRRLASRTGWSPRLL